MIIKPGTIVKWIPETRPSGAEKFAFGVTIQPVEEGDTHVGVQFYIGSHGYRNSSKKIRQQWIDAANVIVPDTEYPKIGESVVIRSDITKDELMAEGIYQSHFLQDKVINELAGRKFQIFHIMGCLCIGVTKQPYYRLRCQEFEYSIPASLFAKPTDLIKLGDVVTTKGGVKKHRVLHVENDIALLSDGSKKDLTKLVNKNSETPWAVEKGPIRTPHPMSLDKAKQLAKQTNGVLVPIGVE